MTKYILIDNDPLILKSWDYAAKKSDKSFTGFKSVADFLDSSSQFDKSVHIYVDSELNDNLRGEIESKKIYELGFKNIYLATGSTFTPEEIPSYIKEVCSKRAPF